MILIADDHQVAISEKLTLSTSQDLVVQIHRATKNNCQPTGEYLLGRRAKEEDSKSGASTPQNDQATTPLIQPSARQHETLNSSPTVPTYINTQTTPTSNQPTGPQKERFPHGFAVMVRELGYGCDTSPGSKPLSESLSPSK